MESKAKDVMGLISAEDLDLTEYSGTRIEPLEELPPEPEDCTVQ